MSTEYIWAALTPENVVEYLWSKHYGDGEPLNPPTDQHTLIDVTTMTPMPQPGWAYDPDTGEFSEPLTAQTLTLEQRIARLEEELGL